MPNLKNPLTKNFEARVGRRPRRRKHPKSRPDNSRSLNRIQRRPRVSLRDRISEISRPTKSISASPKFAPIKWNPPMRREHVIATKDNPMQQVPLLFEHVEKQACLLPKNIGEPQGSPGGVTA
ncbi:hypothetical protein FGIG_02452 [Fasciola gigantica]|uniref:Uncharacterized protein n=1 Tax=Fasciola gigantica TaxID=46835 RepID=A0A504YEA9_FASGI|nr:hypothetical protein FGIG_02452 [Fasciola gigantica]